MMILLHVLLPIKVFVVMGSWCQEKHVMMDSHDLFSVQQVAKLLTISLPHEMMSKQQSKIWQQR
jgi:hypothetical protein